MNTRLDMVDRVTALNLKLLTYAEKRAETDMTPADALALAQLVETCVLVETASADRLRDAIEDLHDVMAEMQGDCGDPSCDEHQEERKARANPS